MEQLLDVIVVGAGVAGLSCARALAQQGLRVVVLEARDRVGGRILTLHEPGEPPLELGAQVIHGDKAATWQVVHEAGIDAPPQPAPGELLIQVGERGFRAGEILRAGVMPPWLADQNLGNDAPDQSVQTVFEALGVGGLSQSLGLNWISQNWCANPAELSAAGIQQVQQSNAAGVGEFVVTAGYDQIPAFLARDLDIRLGAVVSAISWRVGSVEVKAGEETLRARAVVVTVPPPVVASSGIVFEPPLPDEKMAAAGAILLGDAITLVAHLAASAPRSDWGFTTEPVAGFWRVKAGTRRLAAWLKGPTVANARGEDFDGALITRLVGAIFTWLKPELVASVQVFDWGRDPFARGGFSYPRVGALEQPGVWAASVAQTLFFAGEATNGLHHPAFVHGALESGLRASAEVAAALQR